MLLSITPEKLSTARLTKFLLVLGIIVLTMSSRSESSLLQKARHKFAPIPMTPPELKQNPLTPAKIELGKWLFFEPRLSANGTISCHSCHNLSKGGGDGLETSLGIEGQKGKRNSPTVFNAVFNLAQFWDGRATDLKAQAKGPIQDALEMNNTPARVIQTLQAIPGYVERFKVAFPTAAAEAVTFENLAKALEAFEATLLTPRARFDQFLAGDETVLNDQEKRGLSLFLAKDCASCHKGVNLGGVSYHRFGVAQKPSEDIRPPQDKGRLAVTHLASDEYVFRAPTLRNVELTAPYFHSGKVWDLRQAITVMTTSQLGIKLKDQDLEAIVAFLKTLTGEIPQIAAPTLPAAR